MNELFILHLKVCLSHLPKVLSDIVQMFLRFSCLPEAHSHLHYIACQDLEQECVFQQENEILDEKDCYSIISVPSSSFFCLS